ncbi:hypothetical protein BKA82DRAFT_994699 [Pisolithus tinctorius]|uniref:BHLH domain-containing protein n=1 Tax=Pisolithus tinctorius Marx 270 TaxID=870435 RepID=A0A0C3JPA2_PISTI|nr:hypothetical protein BKA82DRAFT_994699 [Pisolithus tinctorius]KIO11028.1 hypothetical protein M404DRAFT_994699 [Pisolithus tinctorius Marx 270]
MDIYAASCNPPRRAKRLRADSDTPGLTRESVPSPCPSNPDEDDDEEEDAVPQPPPPKRRGRKPGSMSRAAREAQRKINHSLIEKARRTKINDALAALRQLVPADYKRAASVFDDHQEDSDDDNHDPTAASKPNRQKPRVSSSGEKEFKLEILVRTVAYLQVLTEKVKALERDGCPHCERPISGLTDDSPLRRTYPVAVADAYTRLSEPPKLASPPSRLPSISTWLPTLTPSQSPSCDLPATSADVGGNNLPLTTHLPTPPTSATFPPSSAVTTGALPPALTLPSPGTFLPSAVRGFPSGFARATSSTNVSGANKPVTVSGNNKGSPGASSPMYTPEDETAASLLLRMSTSNSPTSPQHAFGRLRSSSSSSSLTSLWPSLPPLESATTVSTADAPSQDFESVRRSDARLTPSRLLGLTRRSPDGR